MDLRLNGVQTVQQATARNLCAWCSRCTKGSGFASVSPGALIRHICGHACQQRLWQAAHALTMEAESRILHVSVDQIGHAATLRSPLTSESDAKHIDDHREQLASWSGRVGS